MKKNNTDVIKLLALLLVTPMLVMAYTKMEKTVSPVKTEQTQNSVKGVTPVSIGLIDNTINAADITTPKRNNEDEYILVKSPAGDAPLSGKEIVQTNNRSNKCVMVLL